MGDFDMKNVTIKDVAKYANVSPSTVSRVISNSSRISPETQERVRKAMKKLGYHPNAIARSLVTQRANAIGLILSRATKDAFANPFFPGIIQGIADIAQEEHFSLILSAAKDYQEEHEEAINMLRNRKVDGVILMASRINDKIIKNLLDNDFPFVLIGRSMEIDDIPIVNNDNIKAAYDAVKYLIHKGYERIAIISGPEEYVVSRDRVEGYRRALLENGLNFNSTLVRYTDFNYEGGYESARALLSENKIDAIFAIDDMIAFGALRAVQETNLNIPEDLAIVGFNDDPMVAYVKPALTTVRIPISRMGREAAKMLIRIITDKSYSGEEIIVPTELIKRDSA